MYPSVKTKTLFLFFIITEIMIRQPNTCYSGTVNSRFNEMNRRKELSDGVTSVCKWGQELRVSARR